MSSKRKKTRKSSSIPESVGAVGRFACWWNKTSFAGRVSVITAVIIGVTGSIVGIAHAIPILEPYWYVAQYELRLVQNSQSVATDRQTLFQLQQFLANAEKDPNAANSPTAQAYINNLKQQISETQERLNKAARSK